MGTRLVRRVPPRLRPPKRIFASPAESGRSAKGQSDPRTAVGRCSMRQMHPCGEWAFPRGTGVSEEARSIYDAASQEVAVLLRSSTELWNRTETIPSHGSIYRLHFAAGSKKEGTWDPGYFDFLRTPRQVNEKVAHQETRIDDWGGVLVGVYKPSDPRKYFLPLVGLAVPVTAALDFTPSASRAGRVRDATLALYDPTRRSTVRVAGAQRPLAADLALPLPTIPSPGYCWDSWP